jgi:hypothetical protein
MQELNTLEVAEVAGGQQQQQQQREDGVRGN